MGWRGVALPSPSGACRIVRTDLLPLPLPHRPPPLPRRLLFRRGCATMASARAATCQTGRHGRCGAPQRSECGRTGFRDGRGRLGFRARKYPVTVLSQTFDLSRRRSPVTVLRFGSLAGRGARPHDSVPNGAQGGELPRSQIVSANHAILLREKIYLISPY